MAIFVMSAASPPAGDKRSYAQNRPAPAKNVQSPCGSRTYEGAVPSALTSAARVDAKRTTPIGPRPAMQMTSGVSQAALRRVVHMLATGMPIGHPLVASGETAHMKSGELGPLGRRGAPAHDTDTATAATATATTATAADTATAATADTPANASATADTVEARSHG
jgi:hypothetical protein